MPKKGWGVHNLGKIPKLFHIFFLRAMCRYIILVQTAELWQWVDVNLANIEGSHCKTMLAILQDKTIESDWVSFVSCAACPDPRLSLMRSH